MSFCKVSGCNFPGSHASRGHQCGSCQEFGHGQRECGNQSAIDKLYNESINLPLGKRCKLIRCGNRYTHTTDGHHCRKCNGRRHCIYECPLNKTEVKCPTCREVSEFKSLINSTIILDIEVKCSVCYENTQRPVVFSECGHANICYNCFCKIANHDMKNSDLKVASTPEEGYIKTQQIFGRKGGKIYTKISSQMNTTLYYRRDNVKSSVEYQVGETNQSSVRIDNFINGYNFIKAK
mgnify:CR=1 FL=1